MGKNILVAVDDSENAHRAVRNIAELFTPENRITLFSVVPDTAAMCQMDSPALTPLFKAEQTAFCTLEDKKRTLLQEAMERARSFLMEKGFEPERIQLKLEKKKKGIARDIISESKAGYDVIVLGKRGTSGVRDFLLGSVSQKVLYGAGDISVMFVG